MVKKKTVQPEKDPASLTHTRVRLVELRSLAALINSAGCRGNLHVLRTAGATAIDRPHPPNGIAEADESQRLREKFLLGHDFGFLTLAEAGTKKSAFALPPPQGREGSAELFANRQAVVPQPDCPTVRGKSLPWPFSTWPNPENAEGFRGCRSPHPAAADYFHSLLTRG